MRLAGCIMLLSGIAVSAVNVTFNGGTTYQQIDGIGVNVNFRSWDGTNLQPVLDTFIDQAGMTLFRVTHDLSDWEAQNDNDDPAVMNWNYYDGIYGSSTNEFPKLWDMFAYLNSRGITNGAFFCFMGWGPDWMMDTNNVVQGQYPELRPGMEAEWAETIASALIYARNTRGLQFNLVSPNNEPDLNFEGVRMDTAGVYTNALRRLADLLDANGVTNLYFTAPDRASTTSPNYSDYIPEMIDDPVIMARTRVFAKHSYTDWQADAGTAGAYNFIRNLPQYSDRHLWMTEFNKWCNTCDYGQTGNYDWSYTRATAQHLIWHLLNGASAGFVWEGYDSVYEHHSDFSGNWRVWGYWGLLGVDDINAPVKTYTPRKHFYTVSQVSKWVRPGARRIAVSGGTSSFAPLAAFKHDGLGQVTIVGVNVGTGSIQLNGTLTNLPVVSSLDLYYTTSTKNLAFGGKVTVSNSTSFTVNIPADCVFTLTGLDAQPLTNGIPQAGTSSGTSVAAERFRFAVTNPVARAQFEVIAPTADITLLARKGYPPEGLDAYDYASANPGLSGEVIVVRPELGPAPLTAGDWFMSVLNPSGSNASYTVKATQWVESGLPLVLDPVTLWSNSLNLHWNSLSGAVYVVQGKDITVSGEWQDVSSTITAVSNTTTHLLPLPSSNNFFRVLEGVSTNQPVH